MLLQSFSIDNYTCPPDDSFTGVGEVMLFWQIFTNCEHIDMMLNMTSEWRSMTIGPSTSFSYAVSSLITKGFQGPFHGILKAGAHGAIPRTVSWCAAHYLNHHVRRKKNTWVSR